MIDLLGKKCHFFFFSFSGSKAEQMEVGTTVTIGPRMSIVLCAPITCTDLVVEQKWERCRIRDPSGKVCESAEAPAWKHFLFPVSRNREEKRQHVA